MDFSIDYEYLRVCRAQSGLTNKAIATSKNLSESTVSRFFHGEVKDPSAALVAVICSAIGASVDRAYGIVVTIDEAVTQPAPDLDAAVISVAEKLPAIVGSSGLADQLAEKTAPQITDTVAKETTAQVTSAVKEVMSQAIDVSDLAKELAPLLPAPQAMECDSCRTARLYESTIAFHRQAIAVLGGSLGLLVLIMATMLFFR